MRTSLSCLSVALALAAGLLGRAVQASPLISQGKSVTGSSYYNAGSENFPFDNVTDGFFNDTTQSSGEHSFWLTPNGQLGFVTIDLGVVFTVDSFSVQNTHNRHHYDRGTNAFRISTSSDGSTFHTVVTDFFTLQERNSLAIKSYSAFAPVEARFVRFNIDSFHGSSGGINELQVFGTSAAPVPEPGAWATMVIMGGMTGLGVVRQRRRRKSA